VKVKVKVGGRLVVVAIMRIIVVLVVDVTTK
jgi:hypothetical protein